MIIFFQWKFFFFPLIQWIHSFYSLDSRTVGKLEQTVEIHQTILVYRPTFGSSVSSLSQMANAVQWCGSWTLKLTPPNLRYPMVRMIVSFRQSHWDYSLKTYHGGPNSNHFMIKSKWSPQPVTLYLLLPFWGPSPSKEDVHVLILVVLIIEKAIK